jgi:hypothetical protein
MIIPTTQPANNTAFRLTGSSVYSEGAELVAGAKTVGSISLDELEEGAITVWLNSSASGGVNGTVRADSSGTGETEAELLL